jgi:rRNA processing protein Krr1/Pno1
MSAAEEVTLSKSARKRANQKARAAEGAEAAEEPPAPEPVAKAKAKGKAKAAPEPAPAPEAKAKAKGKAKAAPEPAPAAAKAEAKAKPKAKAAEPKAAAAPKAAAEPKAKAKAAGKAKAKPTPDEEEEPKKAKEEVNYFEMDDGSRKDEWEVSTGLSKKAAKRKETVDGRKEQEKQQKAAGVIEARGNQHIPGLAPASAQVAAGKAQAKAKPVSAVVSAAAAAGKDKEPEKAAVSDNSVSVTIKVPEAKIGRVVGPKGANVNLIKEKTGVKTVDLSGDMCTLVGSADAVALAEHAVRQLIEKGYMSLAFDDFEEEGVPVHPSVFPDIIGSKGAIIQVIKKEAKVEIDIPAVPKNGPAGKKYKITLAGSKSAVALGKEIISSIAMYGHHEVTHPGVTHTEMEIESWQYSYLIGTKGSEMRHIQNNYKVKVNIPRETSECQNVVVIGEPRDVERAIKYIEKALYDASQPKGRGSTDKALGDGASDGEEEDWMQAYMYKRK